MKEFRVLCVLLVLMVGCQTVPQPLVESIKDGEFGILLRSPGLSPNGDGAFDTLELRPFFVSGTETLNWQIAILNETGTMVKTWEGDKKIPTSQFWDGKNQSNQIVPDGTYKVRLTIRKGSVNPQSSETKPFVVDTQGPVNTLEFSPTNFTPDADGVEDTVEFKVNSKDGLSSVDTWSLEVFDPRETPVKRFFGIQHEKGVIVWDGKGDKGESLESATDYVLKLNSRDSLGNQTILTKTLTTGILVFNDGNKLRIRINSITFKPYTADFNDVAPGEKKDNQEVLKLLVDKLKTYPTLKIRLEGHAVQVFYDNPEKGAVEQRDILLPLSLARSEAIQTALVQMGIEKSRMSTKGFGASMPIVPFSDFTNRWKNRRVEFILENK